MNWIRSTLVIVCGVLIHSTLALADSLAVMQGATNETSSQFVILVPPSESLNVEVLRSANGPSLPLTWSYEVSHPSSSWRVMKLKVDGLAPGRDYHLRLSDRYGDVIDERIFQSLDTQKRFPKVALASCMMDWIHNSWAWKQMKSLSPDLIIFLGDTTYTDISSPKDLLFRPRPETVDHWKRFVKTRKTLQVFRWKRLKPILALSDDHDFGYNNSDSSFDLKDQANLTFQTFFGQSGEDFIFNRGPGNSFMADLFGFSFIFLDGRNFRTSAEMFSDEQVSWMKGLRLAKQSFLMTGSQFFGAYLKKDSFEGTYPQAFKNFLVQLGQMPSRFVLASGDIHFSEVMKIESEALGYETYEITSSSIHSLTMPGSHVIRPRNPRRIPGLVTSTHNFLTLEWDTYRSDSITARSHGWRGQSLFEGRLPLNPTPCERLLASD